MAVCRCIYLLCYCDALFIGPVWHRTLAGYGAKYPNRGGAQIINISECSESAQCSNLRTDDTRVGTSLGSIFIVTDTDYDLSHYGASFAYPHDCRVLG